MQVVLDGTADCPNLETADNHDLESADNDLDSHDLDSGEHNLVIDECSDHGEVEDFEVEEQRTSDVDYDVAKEEMDADEDDSISDQDDNLEMVPLVIAAEDEEEEEGSIISIIDENDSDVDCDEKQEVAGKPVAHNLASVKLKLAVEEKKKKVLKKNKIIVKKSTNEKIKPPTVSPKLRNMIFIHLV